MAISTNPPGGPTESIIARRKPLPKRATSKARNREPDRGHRHVMPSCVTILSPSSDDQSTCHPRVSPCGLYPRSQILCVRKAE